MTTSTLATHRLIAGVVVRSMLLLLVALASCTGSPEDSSEARARLGTAAQALTDTDGDGLDDDWELLHFGNLSQVAAGDFDADGMTNGEEHSYGFDPTVDDSFEDADGDRYPNVFELRNGSNPVSAGSTPTPTFVVNGAGGGTHTTISAAVNAANVVNGAWQIIGIAPGTYTGVANLRDVWPTTSKPKLLFIGLEGAARTIIDGEGGSSSFGWVLGNSAVVAALTFRRIYLAIDVYAPGSPIEVRFVDLVVRDNFMPSPYAYPGGLYVETAAKIHVVGSTFVDNIGGTGGQQIYLEAGTGTLTNTVVTAQASGTMLGKSGSATLTPSYCLVKGQTLTGTGNLAGSVDPKLRSDLRLPWDSPLRGAGGTVAQSRIDIDGELRPSSAPDIGVDQFVDSDGDSLEDKWELDEAGNLTTLTSRTQDTDSDGLTNGQEFDANTKPLVADTDGDGISDGDEVSVHSSNPLVTDTDGDDMPDGWEVAHGLSPLLANGFEDADGDRYPNVFEYAGGTDPSNRASFPTPTYVVNGAGGGTHTTISAALNAANVVNGAYQIIGIAPGVYMGAANLRDVTITSAKPKLLFIGLQGAAKTIIDGGTTNAGWYVGNSAVIASLTFRKTTGALTVDAPAKQVRFVDVLVRDNIGLAWAGGLMELSAATVDVIGSTFLDNDGPNSSARQIYAHGGAITLVNTVVWGRQYSDGSYRSVARGPNLDAALSMTYCLVKGQTFGGAGNLAGTVDPKLRLDGRLFRDSPLRGAGGSVPQSRIELDGDLRPTSAPDIGVSQFNDSDADGLPDGWELAVAGNLTSVSGAADNDGDGLSNAAEYDLQTDWLDPDSDDDGVVDGLEDTDNDGIADGLEVMMGTNPRVADADDLFGDLNHDGLLDGIGTQLGYQPNRQDDDGDSISNADELLMGTNPLLVDSDGDGVRDNLDAFPLDPRLSALPANPLDVTAPVITLTAPWYAVAQ